MSVTADHPWYAAGAKAVQRVWADHPMLYGYACPECSEIFPPERAHELTKEHVPSGAMGGRAICLTCRICNNRAGTKLESHLRRREDNYDFASGTMRFDHYITSTVTVGEQSATTWINAQEHGIRVFLSSLQNPPGTDSRFEEQLRRLAATGDLAFNLRLNSAYYRPEAASTAVLRQAYLAAFATFGYWWAYGPAYEQIREKIKDTKRPPHCFGVISADVSPSTRRLLIVNRPKELASIAVHLGRELIFLPARRDDMDFYERFEGRRRGDTFEEKLGGVEVRWPIAPLHLEDFGPPVIEPILENGLAET